MKGYKNGEKLKIPIECLDQWLNILLVNLHQPSKQDLAQFCEILDPDMCGSFEFTTLLTLVAEMTEKIEKKKDEEAKEEDQRYTLRNRNSIRKPKRMIWYEI